MKKIVIALAALCCAATASAQRKADIVVCYEAKSPKVSGGERSKKMMLLAGAEGSKYYNDISLWTDSLESTPEGKVKLMEILRANCLVTAPEGYEYWDFTKGPVKNIYTYVLTDNADGTLTVYDQWGDELKYYTEPADEMQWTIMADSVATVMGYECIMAQADYHGRRWTAWFAPDIPLGSGPWKLRGLPGLILKAEANGGFSFTATGLQRTDRSMTPMYSPEKYEKTDRKKAQAEHEYYYNHQEETLKAQNGGLAKITFTDSDGNEISAPIYDGRKHSLEPDYKEK